MECHRPLKGTHIMGVIMGTELLGAERGMIQALHALREAGARISVGVSGRVEQGGTVGQLCKELDFQTFTIPFGSHFAKEWMLRDRQYRNAQTRRLFSNSRLFRKEVAQRQPDVLVFGSTLAYAFLAFALRRLTTPVVFRVGDAPIAESRFQLWLWKSLARRSGVIVCISRFIRAECLPHLPMRKPVHVISNVAPLRTTPLNQAELDTLVQTKKPYQGVYVGQITPQKGVPDLVEALIALDDPDIGCWILGGSAHTRDLEDTLQAKVKASTTRTRIEFKGFVPDPRPHLKAADWHIAPSTYAEPLGNVVQEAKSQGTPSIVTPMGGLPETLTEGETGWILKSTGAQAIEMGLRELKGPTMNWNEQAILDEAVITNDADTFRHDWVSVIQSILKL